MPVLVALHQYCYPLVPDIACSAFLAAQSSLRARACAEAIKRGQNVRNKTAGICKQLLTKLSAFLAKAGDALSHENRAIILCLYDAIGRASEVSVLNLDNIYWDPDDEMLWTGWNQVKTGRCTEISYHPDAESFLLDVYNALAVYIITSGGKLSKNSNPDQPNWLFPGLEKLADGGAASRVTRLLTQLFEQESVPGLLKEHGSHGLRAGPSDDLAMNELVDVVSIICRGDW